MALKVSKPGDAVGKTARLSKTGKIIIVVCFVIVAILAVKLTTSASANKASRVLENNVLQQIDRAVAVCTNNTQSAQDVTAFADQIQKAKKTQDKYTLALNMIGAALKDAKGNQSATDEINGMQNRLFLAMKQWKGKS